MQRVKSAKVEISTIHDVDGAGFRDQFIQHVDLIGPGLGNRHERGDVSPQTQQRMHFDARILMPALVLRKRSQGNTDRHWSIIVASSA